MKNLCEVVHTIVFAPPSSATRFENAFQRVDIKLGIKEVEDGIWIVSFMRYHLGNIDLEQRTLQSRDNPFGPKLSPIS